LTKDKERELNDAIQGYFKEWLVSSNLLRQIYDLSTLEKEEMAAAAGGPWACHPYPARRALWTRGEAGALRVGRQADVPCQLSEFQTALSACRQQNRADQQGAEGYCTANLSPMPMTMPP
jgi:hypothetical protein